MLEITHCGAACLAAGPMHFCTEQLNPTGGQTNYPPSASRLSLLLLVWQSREKVEVDIYILTFSIGLTRFSRPADLLDYIDDRRRSGSGFSTHIELHVLSRTKVMLSFTFDFSMASNGNRLSVDSCPVEVIAEKPRCVRQVHPVCEEKAHVIAYDKRASLDSNPPAYPLAPNICVEAGRIEFIKMPPDGNEIETIPTPPLTPKLGAKVTVTRAQQTSDDEKFDVAKESLEARITELEEALEAAKITELRDKQTLMKLQKQLTKVGYFNKSSVTFHISN
ncbi:hypothetical protein CBL_00796 [Carabus blaptoides fortunei]